jgi:hypothetical protein
MTALRELLEVSFEAYLQGLASPGVRENSDILSPVGACIWLDSAAEYLLRERRWKDAVQYLGTDVPELLRKLRSKNAAATTEALLSYWQGERVWYLAMASWGDTGSLPPDLCRTALDLFRTALGTFQQQAAVDLQRMSLLYWRLGDLEKASALLARALDESTNIGLAPFRAHGVSNWTFRGSSVHEFRLHCEEMRRMFQGEPLRPAFLGPAAS